MSIESYSITTRRLHPFIVSFLRPLFTEMECSKWHLADVPIIIEASPNDLVGPDGSHVVATAPGNEVHIARGRLGYRQYGRSVFTIDFTKVNAVGLFCHELRHTWQYSTTPYAVFFAEYWVDWLRWKLTPGGKYHEIMRHERDAVAFQTRCKTKLVSMDLDSMGSMME
jgi:hypothetical protein